MDETKTRCVTYWVERYIVKDRTSTQEAETVHEQVERVVRQDEEVANEAAEAANGIRKECEAELNLALPLLEEATAALNTIKQDDIVFIKAMKNPPAGVKLVMEAVCVLLVSTSPQTSFSFVNNFVYS